MQPSPALRTKLRRKTGESIPEGGSAADTMFSDAALDEVLIEASDLNYAIVEVWEAKLAEWAGLVDVTDGAASRRLGSLMENGEARLKYYRGLIASGPAPRSNRTRVGKIIRR
jgi:hypothetical protein